MKTNNCTIEKLSHDLRGIARVDGKTTFIKDALPNEQVSFEYTRRKKDFDEGRIVEFHTKSDIRADSPCHHADICGGCSLQHIQSDKQIEIKESIFLELLTHNKCVPEHVLPPITGPHNHYRNKARISVRYVQKKQSVCIGFREKFNPRYVANLSQCLIINKSVSDNWPLMRTFVESLDKPEDIAQIEVAAAETVTALIFRHLSPLSKNDKEKFHVFAAATGFKVFLQPKGVDSIHGLNPDDDDFYLHYTLKHFNLHYDFHVSDFTQINPFVNEKMVKQAIDWLDLTPNDNVLDLFCGLGNFTLPIAQKAGHVTGVEGSEAMVERAYHNAALNKLSNVKFFSENLDSTNVLSTLTSRKFNKLLLDPPRIGAYTLVKEIENINPECIVYVSCNPITFVRDAQVLIHEKGYRLQQVCVMDMFPMTSHVESMALFFRD